MSLVWAWSRRLRIGLRIVTRRVVRSGHPDDSGSKLVAAAVRCDTPGFTLIHTDVVMGDAPP